MSKRSISQSLSRWGLTYNPFVTLPPKEDEARKRVFTGRQTEVDTLISWVATPRGVLLVGMYGIGKSILALEALRQLAEQGVITVYAKYSRLDGYCLSVLRELALVGEMHNVFKGAPDLKQRIESADRNREVIGLIRDLIRRFGPTRSPLVVVIDELDKQTDLLDINAIILDTRQLIELGCAVVVIGHRYGVTAELSSATDILSPLPLGPLTEIELVEMLSRYLSLARIWRLNAQPQTYPFTEGAAGTIARLIAEFQLTPRLFNLASQMVLHAAAQEGVDHIDEQYVGNRWRSIAEQYLMKTLREEDRRFLEIIYANGGILSEDSRPAIEQIGGTFAEYADIRSKMAKLIQEDILIEREREGKTVIVVNQALRTDINW